MYEHAYRYQIIHKPDQDLIHVKVWEEGTLLFDTGDVFDSSNATLRGGRLGVFCIHLCAAHKPSGNVLKAIVLLSLQSWRQALENNTL